MQALEDAEKSGGILQIESRSVVPHITLDFGFFVVTADPDFSPFPVTASFFLRFLSCFLFQSVEAPIYRVQAFEDLLVVIFALDLDQRRYGNAPLKNDDTDCDHQPFSYLLFHKIKNEPRPALPGLDDEKSATAAGEKQPKCQRLSERPRRPKPQARGSADL